tara:strand:+ start:49 stop:450 length:402 start_codon:yes stop_codon:yes gene_type:complete
MNWEDILKVQVLDTTTSLSSINEPMMEDKNCCEEAKEEWIAIVRQDIGQYEGYDIPPGGYLPGETLENTSIIYRYENMSCEELRGILEDISGKKPGRLYNIHYTQRKKDFGIPTMLHRRGKDLLTGWEECENE